MGRKSLVLAFAVIGNMLGHMLIRDPVHRNLDLMRFIAITEKRFDATRLPALAPMKICVKKKVHNQLL